jgi:hypothetical protein
MTRWSTWILAGLGLVVVTAGPARAQADNPMSRATLRGLPGVEVTVESLAEEVERDGLHEADIRADVAAALRLAGIRVLTEKDSAAIAAAPFLYVSVSIHRRSDIALYAYETHVEVHQAVTLASGAKAFAMTWDAVGEVGSVYASSIGDLRARLKEEVGQFVNAWRAVNPKRP